MVLIYGTTAGPHRCKHHRLIDIINRIFKYGNLNYKNSLPEMQASKCNYNII